MDLLLTIMFLLYYSAALAASEVNKLYYYYIRMVSCACIYTCSYMTVDMSTSPIYGVNKRLRSFVRFNNSKNDSLILHRRCGSGV